MMIRTIRRTRPLRTALAETFARGALTVACATFGLTATVQAIGESDASHDPGLAWELVQVEGIVLGPDGAPADGAVVTSSAGGRSVCDYAGYYRLQVRVPVNAQRIQITAEGAAGSNLQANENVEIPPGLASVWADPLIMRMGTTCSPSWMPTFDGIPGVGHFSGVGGQVHAFARYNDGSGECLYVGGVFSLVGGVPANSIAKWDGTSWSPLGNGIGGGVYAMAVYDDGTGPALYVAGSIYEAGGVPANGIAKWNGSNWTTLATGVNGAVYSLVIYANGGVSRLYAGGNFDTAGGTFRPFIASWSGSAWSSVGTGVNQAVYAMTVHDTGGGPQLYVAGAFTSAGGVTASRVATWDGNNWMPLSTGMNSTIYSLAVLNDGFGDQLYAGGAFSQAGFFTANRVARWDGLNWFPLGNGVGTTAVRNFLVYDDGTGPTLYAACEAIGAYKWNGSDWITVGYLEGTVRSLHTFDDGSGPRLFAGGDFIWGDGGFMYGVAKRESASWEALNHGCNGTIEAIALHDDGSGSSLYAGGHFTTIGGTTAS